ncbi:MAG: Mor transcription activator family protein [Rubrivivax sp.]|nr:Mor transcription activator family protein [Rubrivivax sp.]
MSGPKPRVEVPDFVDGLVRIGVQTLVSQAGLSEEQAQAAMTSISTAIVSEYARTYLYVPVSFDLRDGEIWRQYCEPGRLADGSAGAPPYSHARIEELAVKYGRTVRQIYTVVSARRRAERASRRFPSEQPQLEGLETAS